MQFNDTSTNLGLYQHAKFLVGADDNNFPLSTFTRLANISYYDLAVAMWKADSNWLFDDSNNSGLPEASQNLVAGQKDYTLPTGSLIIRSVAVKDKNGDWHTVVPLNERDIHEPLDEFMEEDGLPQFYTLTGDDLTLYPAPAAANVTTTSGLKVYFLREVDAFTASDTTQEPGLPEPFHFLIAVGAAYQFALSKGRENTGILKNDYEQGRQKMMRFAGARFKDYKPKLRRRHSSYR
jgi:hypothetical protein